VHTTTHLVVVLVVGGQSQKRQRLGRFNRIRMKFGVIVLQVNTRQMTESNFRFDFALLRWRP